MQAKSLVELEGTNHLHTKNCGIYRPNPNLEATKLQLFCNNKQLSVLPWGKNIFQQNIHNKIFVLPIPHYLVKLFMIMYVIMYVGTYMQGQLFTLKCPWSLFKFNTFKPVFGSVVSPILSCMPFTLKNFFKVYYYYYYIIHTEVESLLNLKVLL